MEMKFWRYVSFSVEIWIVTGAVCFKMQQLWFRVASEAVIHMNARCFGHDSWFQSLGHGNQPGVFAVSGTAPEENSSPAGCTWARLKTESTCREATLLSKRWWWPLTRDTERAPQERAKMKQATGGFPLFQAHNRQTCWLFEILCWCPMSMTYWEQGICNLRRISQKSSPRRLNRIPWRRFHSRLLECTAKGRQQITLFHERPAYWSSLFYPILRQSMASGLLVLSWHGFSIRDPLLLVLFLLQHRSRQKRSTPNPSSPWTR